MRIIRAVVGTLLLLVALPLALAAGALWLVAGHDAGSGGYTASTQRLRTDGYALVITDVDALLRSDLPFTRAGQTSLSVSAVGPGGPLFLGLAPYPQVERYLAGVPYQRVTRVRLARGALPVDTRAVPGEASPGDPPVTRAFWLATSSGLIRDGRIEDSLTWSPAAVHGQRLAFVVMNADGSKGVDVRLTGVVTAHWLTPTAWGLSILAGTVLLLATALLAWPPRRRETVYVVEPGRLPELVGLLRARPSAKVVTIEAGQHARPERAPDNPQNGAPDNPQNEVPDNPRDGAVDNPPDSASDKPLEDAPDQSPENALPAAGSGGVVPRSRFRAVDVDALAGAAIAAVPPATPRLLWPPAKSSGRTAAPVPALAAAQAATLAPASATGSESVAGLVSAVGAGASVRRQPVATRENLAAAD